MNLINKAIIDSYFIKDYVRGLYRYINVSKYIHLNLSHAS